MQLCCGARLKGDPAGLAQLSCSVKFGSPLKSLNKVRSEGPDWGLNPKANPISGVPETLMLVSVIVCVAGADPTCCGGKTREATENNIGCVQAVVLPTPRQTSPRSVTPLGQLDVVTLYPFAPCKAVPAAELKTVTGPGLTNPAGAPIWPMFNPLFAIICRTRSCR